MTPIAPNNDKNMVIAKKRSPAAWMTFRHLACAAFMAMAVAVSAHAGLTPLDDTDLERIWGSAGIMFAVKNVQIFHHIDAIRYTAPGDPNHPPGDPRLSNNGYIEFQDFMMHGSGDVARFNYDFGSVTKSGLTSFDVAEPEVAPVNDWSGTPIGPVDAIYRGMTYLRTVTEWDQELAYTIGNISLFDPTYPTVLTAAPVDLGAFSIGLIDMPSFSFYTSPPIGGIGFDFQFNFQMTIDQIGYEYNSGFDQLVFGPIYIGESFADLPGDDPRFPSTWKPNRATPVEFGEPTPFDFGEFQIGDLFGDINAGTYSNPASIDVGEGDLDGAGPDPVLGAVHLGLPMQGSIRFENATFDGTDFGPGAIDGIHVHRLNLFLIQ